MEARGMALTPVDAKESEAVAVKAGKAGAAPAAVVAAGTAATVEAATEVAATVAAPTDDPGTADDDAAFAATTIAERPNAVLLTNCIMD
jgi:hypothetical protein